MTVLSSSYFFVKMSWIDANNLQSPFFKVKTKTLLEPLLPIEGMSWIISYYYLIQLHALKKPRPEWFHLQLSLTFLE